MEYWGFGIPITPTLHHSITPFFYSITPLLQLQFAYFFAGAGFLPMAPSSSL
jgi:hypothetical protein